MYIAETDKITARIHRVDPTLVAGLMAQGTASGQPTAVSPRLSISPHPHGAPTMVASPFANVDVSRNGSITVEAWVNTTVGQVGGTAPRPIMTCGDTNGTGPLMHLFAPGAHDAASAITMLFRDTTSGRPVSIVSQNLTTLGESAPSGVHHIVVVVDGQAQIASFVFDGVVLDGGAQLGTGFVELAVLLLRAQARHPSASFAQKASTLPQQCTVGSSVVTLRVYASDNEDGTPRGYLRTSEIVASYHAGPHIQ